MNTFNRGASPRMETTNFNKLAMGLLAVLLATKALGVFTSAVFAPHPLAKPGFDLPAGSEAAAPAPKADGAPEVALPALLAKADPAKGQADTKQCRACHNFDKDGHAMTGPPLWGVVGRKVASVEGFGYSDVLKGMGGTWTYENIFSFINDPKKMEPGTKMGFAGEHDPQKRADILAYLQTLSDSPIPFPK
jgi:cytochrome c